MYMISATNNILMKPTYEQSKKFHVRDPLFHERSHQLFETTGIAPYCKILCINSSVICTEISMVYSCANCACILGFCVFLPLSSRSDELGCPEAISFGMIPRKPGAIGQQSLHSARSTKPGWTEVGSKRPNALASFIVRPTNTKRIYAALAEIVPGSLLRRSLGKDNDDNDDNGDDDDHGDHGDHEQGKKEKQLGEARSNDKGWNVSSSSPSSRESAAVECENKTGKATDDEADIIDDKDDSDGSDHSKDSETEDELNADAIEKHTSAVSKKASRPKAPGALYQLTLDLGAGFQAGKICPVCGVLLNPGSAEDEALHKGKLRDKTCAGLIVSLLIFNELRASSFHTFKVTLVSPSLPIHSLCSAT